MVEKSHTAGWLPELGHPLQTLRQKVADWFAPPSDASASEDNYEINVELAGVKPGDIDVSIHDNSLIVKGEKKSEREEKGTNYFFSEREYGAFQRTFRLPPDADSDKIEASCADGVLCIRVPKHKEKPKQGRKISVRTT